MKYSEHGTRKNHIAAIVQYSEVTQQKKVYTSFHMYSVSHLRIIVP